MSPRNDTFLSLCLAQAELSPLHYRHGSVIVRGGKVIGQGFNTYRPGFDGGALKTGILPASAFDSPAIKELKESLKSKSRSKFKPDASLQQYQQDSVTFTPSERMCRGRYATLPLSMHSEVMAIHSALSLSSGTLSSQVSARAAAYYQKPCFKLPGDIKKRKAQAPGLKAYAEAVCAHAIPANTPTGKVGGGRNYVQKQDFEPGTSQPGQQLQQRKENQKYEPQSSSLVTVACNRSPDVGTLRCTGNLRRSQKTPAKPPKKTPSIPPNPQKFLAIKNKSITSKPGIAARTKDLRLKGSDLYVARLGSCEATRALRPESGYKPPDPEPPLSTPSPKSEPSSLYDELSPMSRTLSSTTSTVQVIPPSQPAIRISRPCDRCVNAMHAVGIKRVFWTSADGEWEGAKVRDLVEALEIGDEEPDHNDGEGRGLFVTKHEVLMLKPSMSF